MAFAQGKAAAAALRFEAAREIFAQLLPADHPKLAAATYGLGGVLARQRAGERGWQASP